MRDSSKQITAEWPKHGHCPKCGNHLGAHTGERFGSVYELKTDNDGEYLEITCKMCSWKGWRLCLS